MNVIVLLLTAGCVDFIDVVVVVIVVGGGVVVVVVVVKGVQLTQPTTCFQIGKYNLKWLGNDTFWVV